MNKRAEVEAWLKTYVSLPKVTIDPADILGSLRYAGDDADEMIEAFMDAFKVDMSSFDPWQHYDADEPPIWHRYRPYSADGKELHLLPISFADLTAAAENGRWQMDYKGREVRHAWPKRALAGKLVFGIIALVGATLAVHSLLH
jgi:hypothetical protein